MPWWLWLLLLLLLAYIGLLCYRAFRFTPRPMDVGAPRASAVPEMPVAVKLAELLKIPTVSSADAEVFKQYQERLHQLYPLVAQHCARVLVGEKGIIYRWPGEAVGDPRVFMSHYDVVPVQEDRWTVPPFSGDIKDGAVWGRGALDTKCTMAAQLEAAETLLQQGFVPAQDIYFCFAGDEEIGGPTAPAILETLQGWGVTPGLVVDEGGALTPGAFPGVKDLCALIGVAEKGMADLTVTALSKPGHASAPPRHTALGVLGGAIRRLERLPWPVHYTAPFRAMADTLGRQGSFFHRLVFANLDLLKPFISLYTAFSGGQLSALVRTTCAFTRSGASNAFNVLPESAWASANVRILPGETVKSVKRRAARLLKGKHLKVDTHSGHDPSPVSATEGSCWNALTLAINQVWPEAIVSPTLVTGATDARHYSRVSEHVYRFSGVQMTKDERALVHGHDERIRLGSLSKAVAFYIALMEQL